MQRGSGGNKIQQQHEILSFPNPRSTRSLSSPQSYHHKRPKRSRSRSRLPRPIYDILYVYPPSFRNLLGLLILGGILFWLSSHLFVFTRFILMDRIFSEGWLGSNHLAIRKPPLIFVQSPWSVNIVWETTQNRTEDGSKQKGIGLRYWKLKKKGGASSSSSSSSRMSYRTKTSFGSFADLQKEEEAFSPKVKVTKPEGSQNRWVHSVRLDPLESGTTYHYELVLESTEIDLMTGLMKPLKKYGEYHFTWLGINPPDPTQIDHLSSMSVSTNRSITPIEMVIIGDTHSSPSSFRALIKKYLDLKSYQSTIGSLLGARNTSTIDHHRLTRRKQPDLLVHLGNAVEDVREHKQWQTEFWDPLTSQEVQSSEIPIIYARGQHDFDQSGQNLYTGGLPLVEIGEINRTRVALLKNQNNRIILPGISIAERQYSALKKIPRDPRTRASFFSYSPHPRTRILVLDGNLIQDRQAFYKTKSSLTEVMDQEHWLLWEMARPEWKESSIRIILINQPVFIEYADQLAWKDEQHSQTSHYIRTVYGPHFHGISDVTRMYDIPPATMVISSSQLPTYSRGLLRNWVSNYMFAPEESSKIPRSIIKQLESERYSDLDPHSKAEDHGVIYLITPGSGKLLTEPTIKVEHWGFYESSQLHLRQHQTKTKKGGSSSGRGRGGGADYFSSLSLDMAPDRFESDQDWLEDSHERSMRRDRWTSSNLRVYRTSGSQSICFSKLSQKDGHLQQYPSVDRLYWKTLDTKGRLVDQFVIEATSCRLT